MTELEKQELLRVVREEKNKVEKMNHTHYYDGSDLMLKTTPDGKPLGVRIVTSNRTAGKTSFFILMFIKAYQLYGRKFIFLMRNAYEIQNCGDILRDVVDIYSLGEKIETVKIIKDVLYEIKIDGIGVGFSLRLSSSNVIKKYSPIFRDVDFFFMDEYQTEDGKYKNREVTDIQSILISASRGKGTRSRHVELILAGNPYSIMNPYLITFGFHKQYYYGCHFLTNGTAVAEFIVNEDAEKEISGNATLQAFGNSRYISSSASGFFIHNTDIFISKNPKKARYLFTIVYDDEIIGVRESLSDGCVYISNKHDPNCDVILAFKLDDFDQNKMLLNRYSYTWSYIKNAFTCGKLRFSDSKIKGIIYDILGIDYL